MSVAQTSAMFAFLRPLALPRASSFRFLSTTAAPKPTSAPNALAPKPQSSPKATPATSSAMPLYHITRTPSNELPIYHLAKAGGNKKLTRVKGVQGDIAALRAELQQSLKLTEQEVVINWLTRQVMIKGHKKNEIIKHLEKRNF